MTNSMAFAKRQKDVAISLYDRWFIGAGIAILAIGIMMVASSSIVISDKLYHQPFHYLFRQVIYLLLGIGLIMALLRVEIARFERFSPLLILVAIFLLLLVLIPGLGKEVNGSRRWLDLIVFRLQVSELVKLLVVMYLASYLVRFGDQVRTEVVGFIKPMGLLSVICLLLLFQPDFGAAAVIMATALGLMYIAGVRFWQFVVLFLVVLAGLAVLAVSSPYRMARVTTFLRPWANQYTSGYQLTQSLIAFGRGGIFGVGLGESVQKLFYLPEAHTDFLFAVLAEELGLVGVGIVLSLFTLLIYRGFVIARKTFKAGNYYSAYLAYGLTMWIGLQVIINIGVNSGLLPTKGLTLPLMSYGGSSMLVNCALLGLLLRIDHERRLQEYGLSSRVRRRGDYR